MPASLQPITPLQPSMQAVTHTIPATTAPGTSATPEQQGTSTPSLAAHSTVQWSAQTQQHLKLQAFERLMAQLALQIQGGPDSPTAPWPTQGLSITTQQLLQSLLSQVHVSVQGQSQSLQLLAAQPSSTPLMQALVHAATGPANSAQPHSALQLAATFSPTAAAALMQADKGAPVKANAPHLPLLQNWLVQQGTLVSPNGTRGFSITLQVPVAWAQLVGPPLSSFSTTASSQSSHPLRLPVTDCNAFHSRPLPLVLQPGTAGPATSALLWLELQPLTTPPAPAQEVQHLLQSKSDPWLTMATAQAANAFPIYPRSSAHRSHLCTNDGCQYQGRAPCAQPFCNEMNRIWETARTE